jgi:hypothetical protein
MIFLTPFSLDLYVISYNHRNFIMFKQSNILLGKGVGCGVFFPLLGRFEGWLWDMGKSLISSCYVTMGMSNMFSQRCSLNV